MNSENFERHVEFMLAQQAQSAAKIGQLEDLVVSLASGTLERFRATDERIHDVNEKVAALVDSQVRAEDRHRQLDEKFAVLVDSQLRAEERGRKLDEKFAVLIESQARTDDSVKKTDENLRSLTNLVDRYISRPRNGGSNDNL
jgi:hypothetical protein